jgi:hypothetical protein
VVLAAVAEESNMRFRSSVAIDLGTVNTLVWVAGRGIVLEEPTAIAIDTAVGKVAAVGEAADALADKEPQDIQVIHPLRDGVVADLDATAAMLHDFLLRTRHRGSPMRPNALVCVPSGCRTVRSWPLLVLAAPAAAEVWSGWVGIAQKTGFSLVTPLPGIWPSLHLDTAITLPVGSRTWR